MKNILILAAGLTVLWSVHTWAAATVGLNNYGIGAGPIFSTFNGTCGLAPVEGTYVELISTQGPIIDIATQSSIIPMSEPGRFFGGVGIIPNLPDNAIAEVTLRAWRGATTYDTAPERGSTTWAQATGSWNPNDVPPTPPTAVDLYNPSVSLCIPEPSILTLSLIGSAAMLFLRIKRHDQKRVDPKTISSSHKIKSKL